MLQLIEIIQHELTKWEKKKENKESNSWFKGGKMI